MQKESQWRCRMPTRPPADVPRPVRSAGERHSGPRHRRRRRSPGHDTGTRRPAATPPPPPPSEPPMRNHANYRRRNKTGTGHGTKATCRMRADTLTNPTVSTLVQIYVPRLQRKQQNSPLCANSHSYIMTVNKRGSRQVLKLNTIARIMHRVFLHMIAFTDGVR